MLPLFSIIYVLPLCLALPSSSPATDPAVNPVGIHCHRGAPWIAADSFLDSGDCLDAIRKFRAYSDTPFGDTNFSSSATITDGTDGTDGTLQVSDPGFHLPQVFLPRAWTTGSCQVRLALRNTYTESLSAATEIFNDPKPADLTARYDRDSFLRLAGRAQDTFDLCVNGKGQAGWAVAGYTAGLAVMVIGSQADIGNVVSIEGGGIDGE